MKLAVFGGTFNPLHIGHAMLADTIIKELGYDKVLFVPTCVSPHKVISSSVTVEHRLAMVRAFCESVPGGVFEVEPCEIERGGVSYTSDTLRFLTEKYKDKIDGKLAFIMGDEVAAEFEKWKNPQAIVELADLIVVHRYPDIKVLEKLLSGAGDDDCQTVYENKPTGNYKGDFAVRFDLQNFQFPCTFIENPMLPVSSTDIRRRIDEGKSYRYLVPQAVYEYIEENGLYRKQIVGSSPTMT